MSEEQQDDIDADMAALTCTDPVYLIVADESEEFEVALLYAARAAQRRHAKIAVLCVVHDYKHSILQSLRRSRALWKIHRNSYGTLT